VISVERSFFEKFPRLAEGRARSFSQPVVELLRKIAGEERIRSTLAEFGALSGFDFVERALEHFQVRYQLSNTDRENIPAEGRLVIVANHPLGALDALALLHLIGTVRRDVRILANDVLVQLTQLSSLLLPVNVFGGRGAGGLRDAYRALEAEQALIVFPSGEVSRLRPQGVRDVRWSNGFVRLAQRAQAPVLPVHIAAYNSPTFYGLSLLAKPLATLLLAREIFGAAKANIGMHVGETVAASELAGAERSPDQAAAAMRRHVYQLTQRRPKLFATSRAIAHPESPLKLRDALKRAEVLGATSDGKRILLVDAQPDCPVLREIGRLRELSFRRVGEGTGARRDTDRFDAYYQHLLLWDETALAIVGAYRLGEGRQILPRHGVAGLYTSTLFGYAPAAHELLACGVELGRSFIQPAFWCSRSLEHLWQGIGAYLRQRPDLRYLIGPVSLSAALSPHARAWIVHCHRHYFATEGELARPHRPYEVPDEIAQQAQAAWAGRDVRAGLVELKRRLVQFGCSVPTLYRHYVDLCEPDGVRFLGFGTDPAFGNCIDGLICLDLTRLKPAKRERYLPQDAADHVVSRLAVVRKVS
jgi:putative hemolysin